MIDWYRAADRRRVMDQTDRGESAAQALEIAALPDQIRGYETIKEENIARVKKAAEEKLAAMSAAPAQFSVVS